MNDTHRTPRLTTEQGLLLLKELLMELMPEPGDYPTPGGYKVLHTALQHYLEKNNERSY